jgi:hypothetical protein
MRTRLIAQRHLAYTSRAQRHHQADAVKYGLALEQPLISEEHVTT